MPAQPAGSRIAQQGRIPRSTMRSCSINWRSPEQNRRTTGPSKGLTESCRNTPRPRIPSGWTREAAFSQLLKENRWPELADEALDLSAIQMAYPCFVPEVGLRMETQWRSATARMIACMATASGPAVESNFQALAQRRGRLLCGSGASRTSIRSLSETAVAVAKINFSEPSLAIDRHGGIFRLSQFPPVRAHPQRDQAAVRSAERHSFPSTARRP